jgi:hypothetical protein
MEVLRRTQLVNVQPIGLVLGQLLMNFLSFPLALLGWFSLMFSKDHRQYRPIGWMVIIVVAVIFGLSGKAYYLLPIYPVLFAAGAVYLENFLDKHKKIWLVIPVSLLIALVNLGTIPYAIPILPVENFKNYALFMKEKLNIAEPLRWEDGRLYDNRQDYADMFGWEELAREVAVVFHSLPAVEQENCVILASDYGQAGSLDFYRSKYQLPEVISFSGSYYLWGPGKREPQIYLTIGLSSTDVEPHFAEIQLVKIVTHPQARENHIPLLLGRHPRGSIAQLWPELARYRY